MRKLPFFFCVLILNTTLVIAQIDKHHELPTIDELLVKEKITIEDLLQTDVSTTDRTRTQKSTQVPATIMIVTDEQIKLRNYQSLLDVLYDLPDIKIDFGVDPSWMNDVSMRGIRGMDRFIILLDGVRISSPTNDIVPVMENYPVHMAKQIEVVYGPASALYGADALSGVINIITKDAETIDRSSLTVSGGTYGSFMQNFMTGSKLSDKVSFTVSGQYFYDKQPLLYEFYPDEFKGLEEGLHTGTFNTIYGPLQSDLPVSPKVSTTPVSAYGIHTSWKINKLTLSFFRNKSVTPSTQAYNPNNSIFNSGPKLGHSVSMLNGVYKTSFGKFQSSSFLVGSYYQVDPESSFRNVFSNMKYAYKYSYGWMLKGEELLSYAYSENLGFTGGITYEQFFSIPRGHDLEFPIRSKNPEGVGILANSRYPLNPDGIEADFPKVNYNNIGGLLQLQYTGIPKTAITLGTRYDNNSRFGGTFNPRLGVVYTPTNKMTFKGLYGSAFLAPSPFVAFEQFGTFFSTDDGATYQSAFFRLPNPTLKPQIINTFEVGGNAFISKSISIGLTCYYSVITGLFKLASDAGNTNLYNGIYKGYPVDYIEVRINQGRQENYGGAFRIDYLNQFSDKSRLTLYGTVSYITGTVDPQDGSDRNKVEIPSYTPLMFRIGGDLTVNRWSFSPRLILIGKQKTFAPKVDTPDKRQELDGFVLLNASVNYKLPPNLTIFIIGKNLLDMRYKNVNLGAAPESGAAGAGGAELAGGMPQYPVRVQAGVSLMF